MPNVCKSSIFWAKSNAKCALFYLFMSLKQQTVAYINAYKQIKHFYDQIKCKQLVIVILGISLYFIQIKIHKKIAIKQRYFINFVKHCKQ